MAQSASSSFGSLHRTRFDRFCVTRASRHFLAFDSTISLSDRIVFMREVNMRCSNQYDAEEQTELRQIVDAAHPAFGQLGLFARTKLARNAIVACYAGVVQLTSAQHPSSETYTMTYHVEDKSLDIDAEFVGNCARFANDPRNSGRAANLEAHNRVSEFGETFTALVTTRVINRGEELLLDYGRLHRLASQPWKGVNDEPIARSARHIGALSL